MSSTLASSTSTRTSIAALYSTVLASRFVVFFDLLASCTVGRNSNQQLRFDTLQFEVIVKILVECIEAAAVAAAATSKTSTQMFEQLTPQPPRSDKLHYNDYETTISTNTKPISKTIPQVTSSSDFEHNPSSSFEDCSTTPVWFMQRASYLRGEPRFVSSSSLKSPTRHSTRDVRNHLTILFQVTTQECSNELVRFAHHTSHSMQPRPAREQINDTQLEQPFQPPSSVHLPT